ncbi:MAG: DUF4397 domain-containing protein [Caldilineaceae bacterium]|nr:DUF4397 domain-containing protein [Caldilineaceae bacterium]
MLIPRNMNRFTLYGLCFAVVMALAGLRLFAFDARAESGPDIVQSPDHVIMLDNSTIPAPGGTIPQNAARAALLHFAPFAANTSVTAVISDTDSLFTFDNLVIGQGTKGYVGLDAGVVDFSITPTGAVTPTLTQTLTLNSNLDYSVSLIGGVNGYPLELLSLVDTTPAPPKLRGKVRVVHVAPFVAATNAITVLDGDNQPVAGLNTPLIYKQASPFVTLRSGHYQWKIALSGTNQILLELPEFTVRDGSVLTWYIIGDALGAPGNQPLTAVLVVSGLGGDVHFFYKPFFEKAP